MKDFFRGRKTGILILALACTLTVGWVRSLIIYDCVSCPSGQMWSFNGLVYCEMLTEPPYDFTINYNSAGPNVRGRPDLYNSPTMNWDWRCLGFAFRTQSVDQTIIQFIIPYYSMVIPLTALSVWFLFARSRPRDSQSVMEFDPHAAS